MLKLDEKVLFVKVSQSFGWRCAEIYHFLRDLEGGDVDFDDVSEAWALTDTNAPHAQQYKTSPDKENLLLW